MCEKKIYVRTSVEFCDDGSMRPRKIEWLDGRVYPIERVLSVRPCHAAQAGGQGDRYTVLVQGQTRYIYFEHSLDPDDQRVGRWFVERRG